MNIKINNSDFAYYDNLVVNLRYNAVASAFSMAVVFNELDAAYRSIFRPGAYPVVKIEHEGELILTGTLWPTTFVRSAEKAPANVAGYSKTGVLEESSIPREAYPVQYNGLSLRQIAQKLISPFGISLVVDAAAASAADGAYDTSAASGDSGVKSYLAGLAAQKNIILTHDAQGRLVLTKAPATQQLVYHFQDGMPGVSMELQFDGQSVHSHITVRKQSGIDGGNAGQSTIANPYAGTLYRPLSVTQSSGTDNDTALAARNKLAEELRAVRLTIQMDRWSVNGQLLRPGMLIAATSPENFLFNKTNFFIEGVDLSGNAEQETATLTCVLPEVYNGGTPKNIFA